jgi:pentapeptide MXKDX repeat protein
MTSLARKIALPLFVLALGSAGFAVSASADDAMKSDAMSGDAKKADCLKKAEMETDAMKKKDMMASCETDAMSGEQMKWDDGVMKSDDAMKKN